MGIVFIYASYSKILDPASFSNNIHNYGVTSIYIENLVALISKIGEKITIGRTKTFNHNGSKNFNYLQIILLSI